VLKRSGPALNLRSSQVLKIHVQVCLVKFYHLFHGENAHLVPGLVRSFLANHEQMQTNAEEHCFVLFGALTAKQRAIYDNLGPSAKHLVYLEARRTNLVRLLWNLRRSDMLILHGIFFSGIWTALLLRPARWHRTVWVMWGWDVYGLCAREDRLPFPRGVYRKVRGALKMLLRRFIIRRFGAIAALVPGDFDVLQSCCGELDNYVRVFYSDLSVESSTPLPGGKRAGDELRIIVGNSATASNCHLAVLEWLSRYKHENITVICPLTYGNPAYRDAVVDAGKKLLGDKFRALLEMLPVDQYADLLRSADILVFNHNRQQGLFALYTMLFQGKKCFVPSDISVHAMLQEFGIRVFPTEEIPSMSFADFSSPLGREVIENNLLRCQRHLSREASIEAWRQLFARFRKTVGAGDSR